MIKGREQQRIIQKLTEQMQKRGLDALILTSADGVFYSTGFAVRSLYRSGKTGNAVSVVTADGKVTLVCSEFEKMAAQDVCDSSIHIEAYPVWIYIEDYAFEGMKKEVQPDLNRTYRIASEFIPKGEKPVNIGIQSKWITYDACCFLHEMFGKEHVVDCSKLLTEARLIKTPWEIEVLRHNAQMSEQAMYRTMKATVPGMTYADIHTFFHQACLDLAPDLTAISQSHTFGASIAPAWIPREKPVMRGDIVRLDGGPYTNGYKSDLGRSYAVGNYTLPEREELYAALWRGYEWGIQHIGPGVRMCDIFRGVEQAVGMPQYIRGHFGHSISCDISGEEAPFISPEETRVFEPGMVMCFETPFYSSRRHTYNIEDTFVVTEDGIELFTHAGPSLYI